MKKKIALISEHASPLATLGGVDCGGQNVYVAEVAKHLAKLGYVVDVFTRREDEECNTIVNWEEGVRVIHITAGPKKVVIKEELLQYMGSFAQNMIAFIKKHKLDYQLIHANFFMSGIVAASIKKQLGIPFVITFHALGLVRRIHQKEADKFPEERIDIERKLVMQADVVIAECPQDEEDLISLYDCPAEKIRIIPCGFSPREFEPINKKLARQALGLDQDEKIILQLGRMVPRKGVDNVIQAIAHLKKMNCKVRLLIVGGETDEPDPDKNPEIARLQKIAEELDILHQVTFTGRRQRSVLKYYYAASDIFVSTPWYEPFGITPLEAMATGTVVIGSNVGGIKYTVVDGQTGFLVPPKDSETLANRIYLLLKSERLLEHMRKNAIKRVNSLFTWEKVALLCSELYEEVSAETVPVDMSEPKKKQNFVYPSAFAAPLRPFNYRSHE